MRLYRATYRDGTVHEFHASSWLSAMNEALEYTSGTLLTLASIELTFTLKGIIVRNHTTRKRIKAMRISFTYTKETKRFIVTASEGTGNNMNILYSEEHNPRETLLEITNKIRWFLAQETINPYKD